jgi:hypothetical protein
MHTLETDYLIIGSGAVGLAFADTLLQESSAHITIVDRHGKPGGHWNDAYAFVALHQPSAFYGVNSMALGSNRKDVGGVNAGLYELASGPEVSGYFDAVMRQRLLPSGRVSYFPLSDYRGDGRFVSLLSGRETTVTTRKKIVDATYFGTSVPSTHKPKYSVDAGVRLVTPNDLPQLWKWDQKPAPAYVVVGAGKTAMDVITWLLGAGAEADSIHWIVPRDSWLLNRRHIQPGMEFFDAVVGGQAAQMQAFADATSIDDIFHRLEASGLVFRVDRDVRPRMFHYATISEGEVNELRRVKNVIRKGRVKAIAPTSVTLEQGAVAMPDGALYIDCTASAVERRPERPIFDGNLITPQLVRVPQPAFSAALIAYVEAHYANDQEKNALCRPVPFTHDLEDYPRTNIANLTNQFTWMQDKALSRWVRECRLDGFGKIIAAIDPADAEKMAVLGRMRSFARPAMENLHKLAAMGRAKTG